jgi:hypothetical protein
LAFRGLSFFAIRIVTATAGSSSAPGCCAARRQHKRDYTQPYVAAAVVTFLRQTKAASPVLPLLVKCFMKPES